MRSRRTLTSADVSRAGRRQQIQRLGPQLDQTAFGRFAGRELAIVQLPDEASHLQTQLVARVRSRLPRQQPADQQQTNPHGDLLLCEVGRSPAFSAKPSLFSNRPWCFLSIIKSAADSGKLIACRAYREFFHSPRAGILGKRQQPEGDLTVAEQQKREQWGSRIGVILAVAGSAVGLGNFLRFPGTAAQNGGGAFMLPYFVSLLVSGHPHVLGRMDDGPLCRSARAAIRPPRSLR